eukprot:TRINITY_DN18730_c1_g1_i1.p1 TRINITY_DN18730_c1_g1~~TRINITY_DN18730_c1_g1_i1.p1  ORF type:complete len:387 (+),score=64.99 TRINITY_DN18730_c1_g1_i1:35-1195(+)
MSCEEGRCAGYSVKEKEGLLAHRDDPILPPILLTIVVADWGTTEDALRVMMTCSQIYQSLDWEYIFRCIVRRRGGLPIDKKTQLREEVGSWKELCTQLDKRPKNRHLLRCINCKGFPIDGPIFSCLHCYGSDWVLCSDCEEASAKWHPQSHVMIKWPRAYSSSQVQAGRFCYQKLNWVPTKVYSEDIRYCSDCNTPLADLCVGCMDCCSELCLPCGIGKREYCDETKEGREVRARLLELEQFKKQNFDTGDGHSSHSKHRRVLYPPITITQKPEHNHCCLCDICGRIPPWTEKRYRCALCYDYDRCESCQRDVEKQPRMQHAHPMLVIAYAAQRQHIDRINNVLANQGSLSPDYDSDSDFEEDEEEEEEEEEEEDIFPNSFGGAGP